MRGGSQRDACPLGSGRCRAARGASNVPEPCAASAASDGPAATCPRSPWRESPAKGRARSRTRLRRVTCSTRQPGIEHNSLIPNSTRRRRSSPTTPAPSLASHKVRKSHVIGASPAVSPELAHKMRAQARQSPQEVLGLAVVLGDKAAEEPPQAPNALSSNATCCTADHMAAIIGIVEAAVIRYYGSFSEAKSHIP
jgi:hypothetical protein